MMGPLILSAIAALFGFIFGHAFAPFVARVRHRRAIAVRTSYGGVERHCSRMGGFALLLAMVFALTPFVVIGVISPGLLVALALLGGIGALADISGWCDLRSVRTLFMPIALVVFCILPNQYLLIGLCIMIVTAHLFPQVAGADLVPGVPAALYAPPFLSGGAALMVSHHWMEAILGMTAGGALMAVHARHRFPPRWILGQTGIVLLVCVNMLVGNALIQRGDFLIFLILWSYPLVDGIHSVVMGGERGSSPFEKARQRGEPETGLTVAVGSLAFASALTVWTTARGPFWLHCGAAAISLLLAFQFRRFLLRGRTFDAVRPPWHREI